MLIPHARTVSAFHKQVQFKVVECLEEDVQLHAKNEMLSCMCKECKLT